jgi:hypothetical protein
VSWAEWELYDTNDEFTGYLDKETIRKNGAIVKMWDMRNYVSVRDYQGEKYKSAKIYKVYNCKSETHATSAFIFYSGINGAGSIIYSHSSQEKDWEWNPIVPETIGQFVWKIACGN